MKTLEQLLAELPEDPPDPTVKGRNEQPQYNAQHALYVQARTQLEDSIALQRLVTDIADIARRFREGA